MAYSPVMYTGEDVYINGVPLNSLDASGCRWIVTDLDGWWGLPEATIPDDARPFSADGSYYTAGRYGPRVITLTGHIVPNGTNPHAAVEARNTLNRALNMVRSTGILRVDESPSKQAHVQVVGRPLTRFNAQNNDLEFNVQLRASDPRKYSLTELTSNTRLPTSAVGRAYNKTFSYSYGASGSSGMMTLYNVGSYDSFATLRITGPINNPSIENVEQNATLGFDLSLGQDDYLDIDLQSRTVILNSSASRRNLLRPQSKWFNIAPGQNTIRFNGIQTITPRDYSPARANLATNPLPVSTIQSWGFTPGASETGSTIYVTNGDGPEGQTSYIRRVVTVPKTAGTSGIFYRELTSSAAGISGSFVTVSMYVRFTVPVSVQPALSFRSGAATVNTVLSPTISVPAYTWTRIAVTGQSTGSFDSVQLLAGIPQTSVIPGGGFYEASAVLIEQGSTLLPYFDGNTQSASWDGTVGSSVSHAPEVTAVSPAMVYLTYRSAWIE